MFEQMAGRIVGQGSPGPEDDMTKRYEKRIKKLEQELETTRSEYRELLGVLQELKGVMVEHGLSYHGDSPYSHVGPPGS